MATYLLMKSSGWALFGHLLAILNSLAKHQFQVYKLRSTGMNCYKIYTKEKNSVNIKADSSNTYIGQLRETNNESQWLPVLCMEVKAFTNDTYFTQWLGNV